MMYKILFILMVLKKSITCIICTFVVFKEYMKSKNDLGLLKLLEYILSR